MTSPFSVVIPSDSEDSLSISGPSVMTAHPGMNPEDVIVVSKRLSRENVRDGLKAFTYVQDDTPFCFSRRVNLGAAAAGCRDVVIMGDDVEVVTQNAFRTMAVDAPFRIIAASVRGRVGPWWQREGERHLVAPFVSFVCIYLPRPVYEIVGLLDESFPGYGYEDTDYCLRAASKGILSGVLGEVVVEHNCRIPSAFVTTFPGELGEMERAAKEAFQRKWKK